MYLLIYFLCRINIKTGREKWNKKKIKLKKAGYIVNYYIFYANKIWKSGLNIQYKCRV